jgi:hypothetical protein
MSTTSIGSKWISSARLGAESPISWKKRFIHPKQVLAFTVLGSKIAAFWSALSSMWNFAATFSSF